MKTNPQTTDPKLLKRLRMELETIEIQKKKNTAIVQSSYRAWKWGIVKQFAKKNWRIINLVLLLISWVIACVTNTMLGALIGGIVGIIAGPFGVLIGSVVGVLVGIFVDYVLK